MADTTPLTAHVRPSISSSSSPLRCAGFARRSDCNMRYWIYDVQKAPWGSADAKVISASSGPKVARHFCSVIRDTLSVGRYTHALSILTRKKMSNEII